MKNFAKRSTIEKVNNDIVVYQPYVDWLEQRSEVVYSLRNERISGTPFNRLSSKQSFFIGSLLTVICLFFVLI